MTLYFGPTFWWFIDGADSPDDKHYCAIAACCPVGTATRDGARLICKAGGVGWFVAPLSTEVIQTWNGTTTLLVGNKPCLSDWSAANTALINAGFTPTDWFIPSGGVAGRLANPGYACRTHWDTFFADSYWSSTECSATSACSMSFFYGTNIQVNKTSTYRIRAFRCVIY
jgi:hypothetical protein